MRRKIVHQNNATKAIPMPPHERHWLVDFFVAGRPMLVVFAFDFAVINRFNFYEAWPPLSTVMHVIGGFVTAWSIWRLVRLRQGRARLVSSRTARQLNSANLRIPGQPERSGLEVVPDWLLWPMIISFTGLIGIAWEVYEFFLDMVISVDVQPSVADTVFDLVGDVVGSAGFCFLAALFYNRDDA